MIKDTEKPKSHQYFVLLSAYFSLFIAVSVLIGWQYDSVILNKIAPPVASMNPVTAIGFILLSYVLAEGWGGKLKSRILLKFLPVGLIAIGLIKSMELTGLISFKIDQLLFHQKILKGVTNGVANHMAAATAVNFILLGWAFWLSANKKEKAKHISLHAALLTFFISLLSIIGYIYGEQRFYGLLSNVPMAIHTAVCFAITSVAFLFKNREAGFMAQFTSKSKGGIMARTLIPAAIALPIALGFIRLYGEKAGLYNASYGVALFAVSHIVISCFLIWRSTVIINRSEIRLRKEIQLRKEKEKTLYEKNTFLTALLENIPANVFVKEANTLTYTLVNKQFADFVEKPKSEIIGKKVHDLFSKQEAEWIDANDRELLANKKLVEINDARITTNTGEKCLHSIRIPLLDKNGHPQYMLGIAMDITEQKKERDELQQFYQDLEKKIEERSAEVYNSEKRFKALIENCYDAISLINEQGNIIYISPGGEKITAYSFEERKNKSLFENIHPEDIEKVNSLYIDLQNAPGSPIQFLIRYKHKEGHYIYLEGIAKNLFHHESVKAIVVNYHDITEKKKIEEEKKKIEKELMEEKLDTQKQILKATLDGQEKERTAIGMELHDNINQILASTKLYLETALVNDGLKDKLLLQGLENSKLCIQEVRKLSSQLVTPLLETTEEWDESIRLLIKKIIGFHQNKIQVDFTNHVKVQLTAEYKLAIYRILQEQLVNISKHARASKIEVELSEENGYAKFIIKDNGVGFCTKRYKEGIGLNNIKNRAETLNGFFRMESAPGSGCTIEVVLPMEQKKLPESQSKTFPLASIDIKTQQEHFEIAG